MPITIEQMTFMAEQHLLAGRNTEAEGLARQVLIDSPTNASALRTAGLAIVRTGRAELAISFLRRAVQAAPTIDLEMELAAALVIAGQFEEAIATYRSVVRSLPENRKAVRNLSLLFYKLKRLAEANEILSAAVLRWPTDSELHFYLGVVRAELDEKDAAIAAYRRAIEINPEFAEALANLGLLLNGKGLRAEAISIYRQSISLQPNNPEVHCNLGSALSEDGLLDEAMNCYRRAIEINPEFANAHYNMGNAMRAQRRHEEAVQCFLTALKAQPDLVQAFSNLAMSFNDLARHDLAMTAYDRAVSLQPNWAEPRWNRTLTHLMLGDFVKGWSEFERRNELVPPCTRTFPGPRWERQRAPGKTILLNYEMGLGDAIHFVRYVPLVKQRVSRVILECQPELRELFESIAGADEVISLEKNGLTPKYDVHCSLMRLPQLFASDERTMPRSVPYLSPSPTRIERWRERVTDRNGRRRVGLVWAGNPTHQNDQERSLRLDALGSFANDRIDFYSLQRGIAAVQAASPPNGMRLINLAGDFENMADTAGLLAHLDLLIAVDTSVAHLAGAMGKPVWVLMPLVPDWRWMLERSDTPWYPTMRLFRQTVLNDWTGPIERLARALRQ